MQNRNQKPYSPKPCRLAICPIGMLHGLMLLLFVGTTSALPSAELDVWIGTATNHPGGARGIYHLMLDDQTGQLSPARLVAELEQPGFLALRPDGRMLYATGNVDHTPSVVAFEILQTDEHPSLRRMNSQPTGDGGAAHIAVDRTGRVLLSAQYGGGSVASYPLSQTGQIGPRATLAEHAMIASEGVSQGGSGVVAGRQKEPHPHWVGMSPDNRFVLVPDLGGDRIVVYELDPLAATISLHTTVATRPGGGPRHFVFHPSGKFGYVINELTVSLTAFAFDTQQGELSRVQTIATLDEPTKAAERHNSGSEVRVHPTGRFLYSANRGNDTISVFRVDLNRGKLTRVEHEPIRGSWPRNFNLDPSGRWLLAAGRDSSTLAVFEIDSETGALQYTLKTASVPSPICVVVALPQTP